MPTEPSATHGHDCTIANPCVECRKFMKKPPTPTLREADAKERFEFWMGQLTSRVEPGSMFQLAQKVETLARAWVAAARAEAIEGMHAKWCDCREYRKRVYGPFPDARCLAARALARKGVEP